MCIKNRLSHQSLTNNITPYEAWTNQKPDLSYLKVFGSLMFVKKPSIRKSKLNTSLITKGIFLSFTLTKCNAIYYDSSTRKTKTARHFVIDEAHYSNKANHPIYAKDILDNKKLTSKCQPSVLLVPPITDKNSLITVLLSNLYLTKACTLRLSPYKLSLKGDHPNLGFVFSISDTNRVIINNIKINIPAY